jgi:hypothetical protein
MSKRLHFLCDFHLDDQNLIVIWYDDSPDGLLLNQSGRLVSFQGTSLALAYAESRTVKIEAQEPIIYDFDAIAQWAQHPVVEQINCDEFLNAWNMLHDVVLSVGGPSRFQIADTKMDAVYEKIFDGANILRSPEGERYEPTWNENEVESLAQLFNFGIEELRAAISA